MSINIYIKDITQTDQHGQDQMKNLLIKQLTLLDAELGYNNFFVESNKEKVNVKILDDLIDNYLKIRKKHTAKSAEEIERNSESDLTSFQIMKYEFLKREKRTWSEKN